MVSCSFRRQLRNPRQGATSGKCEVKCKIFVTDSPVAFDLPHLTAYTDPLTTPPLLLLHAAMSVTLHTTHGPLKLELFCQACPKTTYNFLALAASSFYDRSPFHRLIPNFMIQGGSPATGTVKDSPSIYNSGGSFEDEIKPSLRHHGRGIVSMANKGPGTNGSQFFVTFGPAPHLDGKNTVFGRVLEGWDTLDRMEGVQVDRKNRPIEAVRIEKVVIHANPLADER